MRVRTLGAVERQKPYLFFSMKKWHCTVFDLNFGIGDTPSDAYWNYMKEIGAQEKREGRDHQTK